MIANNAQNSLSSSKQHQPPKPIPITVLSGFLGSGKTCLLKHLLENKQGLRIAVIVNDVASVNIDSKLLSTSSASSSSSSGMESSNNNSFNNNNRGGIMLELQNGCACCSRSEELLASVAEVVTLSDMRGDDDDQQFQHIVIEMSGVADPKGVRAKFQEAQLYDMPLMERVRLDTMVTLIDCTTFLKHLKSAQVATPQDAPELYYKDVDDDDNDANHEQNNYGSSGDDFVDDLAFGLFESMSTNSRAYGESVGSLLVSQTETADVVLLNKVDLLEDDSGDDNKDGSSKGGNDVLSRTRDIVAALNPRAKIFATRFGQVEQGQILEKVLASARGQGVVMAGVVDDHRDAVQAVVDKNTAAGSSTTTIADESVHSHSHEHAQNETTDSSHSSHDHDHDHAASCDDPDCTDPSHDHAHNHLLSTSGHSHSHDHQDNSVTHAGIGSFVYRARRPFHPRRLFSFLQNLPVTRGLEEQQQQHQDGEVSSSVNNNDDDALQLSPETLDTLQNVIRSKGFCWLADSNCIASFWSHAGTSFELQQLGSWWATLPRNLWPQESIEAILVDFDDVNHQDEDNPTESVGDRRQEVVLIGPSLADPGKQKLIQGALDQCLLSDDEWTLFNSIRSNEEEMTRAFPNPIAANVMSY